MADLDKWVSRYAAEFRRGAPATWLVGLSERAIAWGASRVVTHDLGSGWWFFGTDPDYLADRSDPFDALLSADVTDPRTVPVEPILARLAEAALSILHATTQDPLIGVVPPDVRAEAVRLCREMALARAIVFKVAETA